MSTSDTKKVKRHLVSKPVIAFLHTASAHQVTFNKLLKGHPVKVTHSVNEGWLTRAQEDGLTDELIDDVSAHLRELDEQADVVVCSCSTLGPIAQSLNLPSVIRVDQPLMDAASAIPGTALLAMCLDSTVEASSVLLETAYAAQEREPEYEVVACPEAWSFFLQNDLESFAREIESAIRTEADVIADLGCIILAQASMSVAADRLSALGIPVLTSPPLAAEAALALAGIKTQASEESSPEVG